MVKTEQERIVSALERIADAVELLAGVLIPPQEHESTPPCAHPDTARIDMRTMGSGERWYCRTCGHQHPEE